MQIESELSTESAEESVSDEVITSLDRVDINDCKAIISHVKSTKWHEDG